MKERVYKGNPISPGIVQGTVVVFEENGRKDVPRYAISISDAEREINRFQEAVNRAKGDVRGLIDKVACQVGKEEAKIFEAHLMILEDKVFLAEVEGKILKDRMNTEAVLSDIIEKFSSNFSSMEDEYIREKSADISEIGRRILSKLLPGEDEATWSVEHKVVVAAKDLSPGLTVHLELDKISGFIGQTGGVTSHAAILARSLGVPAVTGIEANIIQNLKHQDIMLIDGDSGTLVVNPEKETSQKYAKIKREALSAKERLSGLIDLPSVTLDGQKIELLANVGRWFEIERSLRYNPDGIGLYRTEFMFMSRRDFPSEDVQYERYRMAAEAFGDKKVAIRILDIGGDKSPSYFPLPRQMNPQLGWRGCRLLVKYPDILKTQMRAILRASAHGKIKILYPMISSIEEARRAKTALENAMDELAEEGFDYDGHLEQGIMIEVPSAALIADLLLEEMDFLSIGTNDLVQYILAVDRNDEQIAQFYEPLNPAVLRVLEGILKTASSSGRTINICGEIAGDPSYTKLLLGMGYRSFSMNSASICPVKEVVRSVSIKECEKVAQKALELSTSEAIKESITADSI